MRLTVDICVGSCPTCGANIDVSVDTDDTTIPVSCGRRDCQLEFRNVAFRQWFADRIREIEMVARAGGFIEKKSRAA